MAYIEGDALTRAGESLCRVAMTAMMARIRKSLQVFDQAPHQQ
jgi:hypothetical protein